MLSGKLTFKDVCDLVLRENEAPEVKGIGTNAASSKATAFFKTLPPVYQDVYDGVLQILKDAPDGLEPSGIYARLFPAAQGKLRIKPPIQIKQLEKLLFKMDKVAGVIDFDTADGTYKQTAGEEAMADIELGKETPTIEDDDFEDLDSSTPEEEHPSIRGAVSDYKKSLGHPEF